MEYVHEPSSGSGSDSEPLFFNFLLVTGVVSGAIMGGYFGWCVGGIGGALAYGTGGAVIFGICAALFSALLRILISISIVIAIIIVINLLWGKGKTDEVGSKPPIPSRQLVK
jgi:hypothetical protein